MDTKFEILHCSIIFILNHPFMCCNRENDLILIMTPEEQDKTSELSKHWSVDSTPARNEVIIKWTYPVKSVKCDKISSNVLHSRALLQKSATGCLIHHYSYLSAQFVENNTLDQIDGNYTLEKLVWTILWKKGARLDKFTVLKNVG